MMKAKQAGAVLEIALLVVDPNKAKEGGGSFEIEGFDFDMSATSPALETKQID